jgi:cation diffusion facilitator CzcD-associated flavoprotein CzcO
MDHKQFRVVIVGAGVSGLVLAHALELAKIDFILLEKGVVAPPWGTSITSKIVSSAVVPSNSCRKWFQQELGCCIRLVVWKR